MPSQNVDVARQVELDTTSGAIEMPTIEGWRLQFIPSEGDFAGQLISRVFVTNGGSLGEAKRVCRNRYGAELHILAGAALHTYSSFGVWEQ